MSEYAKIKIGLDFHGVITSNPEYFKKFAAEALKRKMELHVISGGPKATIEEYLRQWQIPYTTIFAILDFYDAKGCVKFFENGEFKVDDDLWNSAKAQYCEKEHIDLHIDDSLSYSEGFSTPFCFYDGKAKQCQIEDKWHINFQKSPEQTLEDIEIFIKEQRAKDNL